ncbi:MAG: xanthine dehydrogenase family protein subunit M [Pyrobaculum sp.]
MYPPPFEYAKAKTLEEAVTLLSNTEGAVALAGGQSLIPLLKLRILSPPLVVDLNGIKELRFVESDRVGALARHYQLEEHSCLLLRQVAKRIGDPQIRTMGTLGGSLAHADPRSDWAAAMLAVDAIVTARGPSGFREIPIDIFFKGPYTTALERGELITEVKFKCPPRSSYVKISRRHNDFAIVAVAAAAAIEESHFQWVRVAALGAAERPVRLRLVEERLQGAPVREDVIIEAAEAAKKEALPPSDLWASGEYRRALLAVAVKRALAQL